jgi:hypothetical protein
MNEPNPAQDSGAQKQESSAQPAQQANDSQPQNGLTADAVKLMIEEAFRPMHAELRRVREGVPVKQKPQDQAERTLAQRVAEIEAREQRLAERSKIDALKDAAIQAGVLPERVDIFVDHVLAQRGKEIVSNDNGAAWVDIDPENPRPLSELIAGVLKTKGDIFKAPAQLPSGRGLRGSRSGRFWYGWRIVIRLA